VVERLTLLKGLNGSNEAMRLNDLNRDGGGAGQEDNIRCQD
jgi:hypothetical protein